MPTNSLRNSRLNALSSYVYFIIGALITFFVSPYLLLFLGASAFGILKSVQKWLDFATVADGRPSQALKWVIAKNKRISTDFEKRQFVGSAIKVSVFFLPLLLCVVGILVYLLPSLINGLAIDQYHMVSVLGMIFGANIVLGPLLAIPDSVLAGENQAYRATVIRTFWLIMSNIAMLYFAYLDYSLIAIAMVIVISAILNASCVYFVTRKNIPWMGSAKPDKPQFSTFMTFSGWVLSWTFVSKILLSSELLLVGYLIGAEQVSVYIFSTYITTLGLALALMTGSAFMPMMGQLLGEKNIAHLLPLLDGFREVLLAIVVLIGGGVLALNASFVNLWVGNEYFVGNTINALIVIAFAQLVLLRGEAQIQDLSLSIQNKVLVGVLSSVISVALAIVLYRMFNNLAYLFVGVILGRSLMTILFPIMVNKLTQKTSYPIGKAVISLFILLLCYLLGENFSLNSWWTFLLGASVVGGILLGLSYTILLSNSGRALMFHSEAKS